MQALAKLTTHPGFKVLRDALQARREAEFLRLGKTMLLTSEPANQRNLDYLRGYWQAIDDFASTPDKALEKLRARDKEETDS